MGIRRQQYFIQFSDMKILSLITFLLIINHLSVAQINEKNVNGYPNLMDNRSNLIILIDEEKEIPIEYYEKYLMKYHKAFSGEVLILPKFAYNQEQYPTKLYSYVLRVGQKRTEIQLLNGEKTIISYTVSLKDYNTSKLHTTVFTRTTSNISRRMILKFLDRWRSHVFKFNRKQDE